MFSPKRALLNPKFEGYRLDPLEQDDTVFRYALQHKPTQSSVSGRAPLSFHEVQSRITHNHLAIAPGAPRALYIDSDYNVVLVLVDPDTLVPDLSVVYTLPKPIHSDSVEFHHPEYPSAAFLSQETVFLADGHGTLYILQLSAGGVQPQLKGVYELPTPFRVHNVAQTVGSTTVAVISSKYYPAEPPKEKGLVEFDIQGATFNLTSLNETPRPMEVTWHYRGTEVPISSFYESSSHFLVGGSIYHPVQPTSSSEKSYEPTADEMAPIPRAGETLDGAPKPPAYSWTQSPDDVTIAFPLPSSTPKSSIKVSFSIKTLTIHIAGENKPESTPYYSGKSLWDTILPSASMWTWDKQGENAYGVLTLHLEKKNEGTKWMHVFESQDAEVPETLDPSELFNIREALEKHTAPLVEDDPTAGIGAPDLGLGHGVPSLAEGEMDDEVDIGFGRSAVVTVVGKEDHPAAGAFFTLVATSLPGNAAGSTSLVVKHALDGTVFTLDSQTLSWEHTSTFNALAFVLASKRDTRFTHHIGADVVFAFENGIRDRGGNVYIYRALKSGQWAKQAVLKVGGPTSGSLLGVGAVIVDNNKRVIMCLTEGELVLMRNIV